MDLGVTGTLQNFKTLLMPEITVLLGNDIEWATIADPPVLATDGAADDGDRSMSEDS
eukprot:CAMPEP_0172181206 /NCGR_PEP_ID=MMETSP1050-20130122/17685_1 /TAXON_ID=233186 /ORGANISM="Cryptomonas curvata, Strain CCAP979/52" /LENGTH=56 /DNA_ID=CAMNT_0012854455 /DNA_START=222 /DNA_END=389 /DNA_ORIENTATION=-